MPADFGAWRGLRWQADELRVAGRQELAVLGALCRNGVRTRLREPLLGERPARKRERQCLRLDRRAIREAGVADTLHQGRCQAEGFEGRGTGVWLSHQIVLHREWVAGAALAKQLRKRYKASQDSGPSG